MRIYNRARLFAMVRECVGKKSNFVETVLGFVGVDIIIESGWSLFRIKIEKYSKVNIIR